MLVSRLSWGRDFGALSLLINADGGSEVVEVRRVVFGGLTSDDAVTDQTTQRVIHRDHLVSVLTGGHEAIDLTYLVFANEVLNRGCRDHGFQSHDAALPFFSGK